jgi:hypothetical protein
MTTAFIGGFETICPVPMKFSQLFLLLIFGSACSSTIAQQPTPVKEEDFAGVNSRGDQGMGFSHEKTTHRFHLLPDGGAIEVQSNEPSDAATQDAIRSHLAMIGYRGVTIQIGGLV